MGAEATRAALSHPEAAPATNLPAGLRRARELSGYSQEDVGATLGVSRAMVSYWESGTR